MNLLALHNSCVCVHSDLSESGYTIALDAKSPYSGLCIISHTPLRAVERSSSSSVASQSASSVVGATHESTSTLLALCRVVDNA